MADFQVGQLIIYIVVLLFAISAHEAAHAWMSYKFGDDTAYLLGRVTINRWRTPTPSDSLIPIISFIAASAGRRSRSSAGASRRPSTPALAGQRQGERDGLVAGIMANTAIAIDALLIIKILQTTGLFSTSEQIVQTGSVLMGTMSPNYAEPVWLLLYMTLVMNASLAVFNLMPFPPLDGSKVLETFLPASMQPALAALEQYGYLILMAAVYFGLFRLIFAPVDILIDVLLRL